MRIKIEQIKSLVALAVVLFLISFLLLLILPVKISFAAPTNTVNAITATLIVPNTCIPYLSATAIAFPSTTAGSFAPTSNDVNVMNVGNIGATIFVGGGNWIYLSNSFLVGNTLWSPTSGANIGTPLTGSSIGVNTLIPVKNLGMTGGNDIYFGVNIPAGQTPGAYSQTINMILSC
ncbi:MAG: hypothetical protein ABSD68_03815 [Candidatus Micrarchaeales archaeon]|jgi:hypothetical protein